MEPIGKILVVDDDPDTLGMMKSFLECDLSGVEVCTAGSLSEAKEIVRSARIAAAVVDGDIGGGYVDGDASKVIGELLTPEGVPFCRYTGATQEQIELFPGSERGTRVIEKPNIRAVVQWAKTTLALDGAEGRKPVEDLPPKSGMKET